jgi:hypothetical protein
VDSCRHSALPAPAAFRRAYQARGDPHAPFQPTARAVHPGNEGCPRPACDRGAMLPPNYTFQAGVGYAYFLVKLKNRGK